MNFGHTYHVQNRSLMFFCMSVLTDSRCIQSKWSVVWRTVATQMWCGQSVSTASSFMSGSTPCVATAWGGNTAAALSVAVRYAVQSNSSSPHVQPRGWVTFNRCWAAHPIQHSITYTQHAINPISSWHLHIIQGVYSFYILKFKNKSRVFMTISDFFIFPDCTTYLKLGTIL